MTVEASRHCAQCVLVLDHAVLAAARPRHLDGAVTERYREDH